MENKKPNYFAVIPAPVRYSKILSANAKLLYGEISALANLDGYCWASNRYFQDLYLVNRSTISEWIRQLKDAGFIRYEIESNYKRKIYLIFSEQIVEKVSRKKGGVSGKPDRGIWKTRQGVSGKQDNNNILNKTSNNIYINKLKKETPTYLGRPMRKDNFTNLWKVLDNGEWCEFAGKESEIKFNK